MIPLSEAQEFVLGCCARLETDEQTLSAALGSVCAEDITAAAPVPPFDNTAMDGFAVQAADTADVPVNLRVIGDLAAGASPTWIVNSGEAVRIMTGAPMPGGADSVVIVEHTKPAPGKMVEIQSPAKAGDNVRRAGSDLAVGDPVIYSGTVLSAGHLGLVASVGRRVIKVVRKPVVGVISTGDELVEGDGPLGPGKIYDSNRLSLLAALRDSGFEAVDLGLAKDNEVAIEEAMLKGAATCDAILSSGGVSVGDFDYTKVVLDRLSGGTMRWMQIAIKPAKPFAFGLIKGIPFFGLPGNPVSSMVSFECLARPALRQMAGFSKIFRDTIKAVVDEPLKRHSDGKLHLMRVVASIGQDGRIHLKSAGAQGSHQLVALAGANALALVPDGSGITAGGETQAMLIGPLL